MIVEQISEKIVEQLCSSLLEHLELSKRAKNPSKWKPSTTKKNKKQKKNGRILSRVLK